MRILEELCWEFWMNFDENSRRFLLRILFYDPVENPERIILRILRESDEIPEGSLVRIEEDRMGVLAIFW